jgi:putative hydrolase of the HAD superfamily
VARAIIFDLFHTLTTPEAEWSDLPWTSDVLGISRAAWYEALTTNSRQRLIGEITDAVEIVRLVAHSIDPATSEDLIARAALFRKERFIRVLTSIPESTVAILRELRRRGMRLGLISNCDASEGCGRSHYPSGRAIFPLAPRSARPCTGTSR